MGSGCAAFGSGYTACICVSSYTHVPYRSILQNTDTLSFSPVEVHGVELGLPKSHLLVDTRERHGDAAQHQHQGPYQLLPLSAAAGAHREARPNGNHNPRSYDRRPSVLCDGVTRSRQTFGYHHGDWDRGLPAPSRHP